MERIDIKVEFRVFPEGDVIALFIDTLDSRGYIESYQHVGQHGDASPELLVELRLATPAEYKALASELRQIGYNLLESK